MAEAYAPSRFRAGLVKCAFVLALLWAAPAAAQQIPCGPAEDVKTFLMERGLGRTANDFLRDGDVLEAWEGPDTIVLVILVRDHPDGQFRCLVRELPIKRKGQGV